MVGKVNKEKEALLPEGDLTHSSDLPSWCHLLPCSLGDSKNQFQTLLAFRKICLAIRLLHFIRLILFMKMHD